MIEQECHDSKHQWTIKESNIKFDIIKCEVCQGERQLNVPKKVK